MSTRVTVVHDIILSCHEIKKFFLKVYARGVGGIGILAIPVRHAGTKFRSKELWPVVCVDT